MSFKSCLLKTAIKMTPNFVVSFVANLVLKGIAEISDFMFDIDSRTVFIRVTLLGEQDPIEISINGFSIISGENTHQFYIQQAESNRLWLNNIFARIVGKKWKIPDQPQYRKEIELVAELLSNNSNEQAE